VGVSERNGSVSGDLKITEEMFPGQKGDMTHQTEATAAKEAGVATSGGDLRALGPRTSRPLERRDLPPGKGPKLTCWKTQDSCKVLL
jgi:hypothetical protein